MKLNLENIPSVSSQINILDLRFNRIRDIPTGIFKLNNQLESLLINNNYLKELKNGTFNGLINLTHLYLYKNRITNIESGTFERLNRLQHLYLNSNGIKHINDGTFTNLPSLDRLFLYSNNIQTISPKVFQNLPRLKRLRLDQNLLVCDCKLAWLIDYSTSNSIQVSADCNYPLTLFGRGLKDVTAKDLHCEPPKIMEEPHDIEVKSGDTAIFHCKIEGEPKPSLTWMKNDKEINFSNEKYSMMNDGSLMIKNANNDDKGNYECLAKNFDGKVKSRSARMLIIDERNKNYGPPTIIKKPTSISTINGTEYVKLICEAIGKPSPIITWSFNGVEIGTSDKYLINPSDGSLIINIITTSDHGTYTCFARNSYGRDTAEANIIINSSPLFTIQPENIETNVGNSIKFECVAVGSPKPEINWYKNDFQINQNEKIDISDDGSLLRINNISLRDAGVYICEARNSLGSIEVATELKIIESNVKPPKFLYKPYNIEAFSGSTIEIPCQAEGEPSPGIQWQKDGATMQRTGRAKTSLTGSLYIYNINSEDQGRYECIAINEYGRSSASGYLTVKEDPTAIKINGIGDRYVKIAVLEATEEVDKAINNTIENLFGKNRKPPTSGDLFKLFRYPDAPTRELAKAAEIYERTLVNIRKRIKGGMIVNSTNDYNYREILSKEHLDLIAQLSGCTTHRRIRNCSNTCYHNRYRSIDGTCNNFQHPTWGASLTPFRRLVKPIYEDGFGKPVGWDKNKLYYGYPKPLARLVSTKVISTHRITEDNEITHMVMQWGQFLDHDLDHSLPSISSQSWDGVDCKKTCDYDAPCFPMDVPLNDPRIKNRRCIDFIRTSAVCGSGMTSVFFNEAQPREQINQLTSYIDASQVYGFSRELAKGLRDLNNDGGRLREGPQFDGWKPLLPFASNEGIDCRRNLSESDVNCFAAGDIRVNEQLGLIAMHTIWMREHNRVARELKLLNPTWDGDTLYHEARKIIGAAMQHITYKYWLPFIIGEDGMKILGEYKGYNQNTRPDISNVFATAALRFGHTLINPILHRFNEEFQPIREGHIPLRYAFFAPSRIVNEGGIDPLLRGLFVVPAKLKKTTENLNTELTEQLFRTAHAVALDLAAMNIQRSRDHGLPGYLEYRKFCNMSHVENFDDLYKDISNKEVLRKLEELYGHPGNIDVFVGGILEDQVNGGRVGPLFQCLLIEQFKKLRDGDRFYYENPSVFTQEQLNEIKKYTLSRVLCDNGDNITKITENTFLLPEIQDGLIECKEIPKLDLRYWTGCCDDCKISFTDVFDDINYRNRRESEISSPLKEIALSTNEYSNLTKRVDHVEYDVNRLKYTVKRLRKTVKKFEKIINSITNN